MQCRILMRNRNRVRVRVRVTVRVGVMLGLGLGSGLGFYFAAELHNFSQFYTVQRRRMGMALRLRLG